jgi:ribonuclease HI
VGYYDDESPAYPAYMHAHRALAEMPEMPGNYKERHFQEAFAAALDEEIAAFGDGSSVRENLRLTIDEWPGVGPVDVAVIKEGELPTLFELKWGVGTLYNCVWDLAKTATAIASGRASSGYLVAGAHGGDWMSALGSELFESDEWETAELLRRYAKHWEFWRKDVKTHPLRIPDVIRTRLIAITSPWHGWQIRCLEVLVPVNEWLDVAETQAAQQALKDRLTWAAGDVEILTPEQAAEVLGFNPERVDKAQSPSAPKLKRGFYVLKTDGGIMAEKGQASGPAAIGVVLKDPGYRDVDELSKAVGWVRNHHEAEYRALIEGLALARRHGVDQIRVFLDSALVVNTVNGDWNVKPEHLTSLLSVASDLVAQFEDIKVCWVPREMNSEADALANRALGRDRSIDLLGGRSS